MRILLDYKNWFKFSVEAKLKLSVGKNKEVKDIIFIFRPFGNFAEVPCMAISANQVNYDVYTFSNKILVITFKILNTKLIEKINVTITDFARIVQWITVLDTT